MSLRSTESNFEGGIFRHFSQMDRAGWPREGWWSVMTHRDGDREGLMGVLTHRDRAGKASVTAWSVALVLEA